MFFKNENHFISSLDDIFWPAFQMMKSFKQQVLTIQAKGHDRQIMNGKAIQCEINRSYAHLIEVVVESTFQPLLQWYVVFPGVYAMLQDDALNLRESLLNPRSFKNVLEFSSWLLSQPLIGHSLDIGQCSKEEPCPLMLTR